MSFFEEFHFVFIEGDRWKWLVQGLGATLAITGVAMVIGVVLGLIVASVRSTYDKNGADMKRRGGAGYVFLKIGNFICNLYLTVIRGTPVVVQLMIIYFVILAFMSNGLVVAMIAFGLLLVSVTFGLVSGRLQTLADILESLSSGIRLGAPLFIIYVLAVQFVASLRFVFWL